MPSVPAPEAPLAQTPTFRFSGKSAEIVMPDGRVADAKALPSITRWTSLKLSIAVERYPFEWAEDRAPRVPAARALAAALGRAAPWKFAHTSMGTSWGGTAAPARRVSKAGLDAFTKKVLLQRFNANAPGPSLLVRTGGELDVQYAWSMRVTDLMLEVFAQDSAANRAKMGRLFELVRRSHAGAVWATLGHGYAGSSSTLLAGVRYQWGPISAFRNHEQKQLAPPWRWHIGRLWTDIPAARAKAEAFVKGHAKNARLDDHGLELSVAAPESATDRAAALTTAARQFSTLRTALGKIVNTAMHDRKQRKEILGPKR